jgi:hypothetical protein
VIYCGTACCWQHRRRDAGFFNCILRTFLKCIIICNKHNFKPFDCFVCFVMNFCIVKWPR